MTDDLNDRPFWDDWLESHLFDKRVVLLRGPLDAPAATRVASQLMALDGSGDAAVQLQLDSPGGPLEAAFAVADVIEVLGVPVEVLCMGRVEATAVLVAAVSHRRSAFPHCRFRLGDPSVEIAGPAGQLEAQLAFVEAALGNYHARLASTTGHELAEIEKDCSSGAFLDASGAVAYGIVDKIVPPRLAQLRSLPPAR
ncbi:MAG: ATP-dependent Clp protease proteolytic subunit [Acidimicrobiales bacterium]